MRIIKYEFLKISKAKNKSNENIEIEIKFWVFIFVFREIFYNVLNMSVK
jgi:hypothetical protein